VLRQCNVYAEMRGVLQSTWRRPPRVSLQYLFVQPTAAAQVYVSKTMGKPALLAEEEEEDKNDAAESFELFSEAVSPTYQ
jgi:hypothetical protein